MGDKVTIHTRSHPIRMMLDGYYDEERYGVRYQQKSSITQVGREGLEIMTLAREFKTATMDYLSEELRSKVQELMDHNTEIKRGEYSNDYIFDERAQHCFAEHKEIFMRIAHSGRVAFDQWELIFDEDGNINPDFEAQLLPLDSNDYISGINLCHVRAVGFSRRESFYLPADPMQLFNAMALAENDGVLLHFQMPEKVSAEPTPIRVMRPSLPSLPKSQLTM